MRSFGTEGRKADPAEEIPPSDQVFDYIVFRGSDIKDLHVIDAPQASVPASKPQIPNDPAILGVNFLFYFRSYFVVTFSSHFRILLRTALLRLRITFFPLYIQFFFPHVLSVFYLLLFWPLFLKTHSNNSSSI